MYDYRKECFIKNLMKFISLFVQGIAWKGAESVFYLTILYLLFFLSFFLSVSQSGGVFFSLFSFLFSVSRCIMEYV